MPTHRMKWLVLPAILVGLALATGTPAFGQGTATSSISGTVLDSTGGVIPGATVVITNEAGASFTTASNVQGVFAVPALGAGTYTVTVTLSGFKTAVIPNVRLLQGQPIDLKVELSIGEVAETVTVASSAELVNTQTATVSSTLNADQLNRMPTTSRNALNAVTFLTGVNTPGTNRNSTVNGLPESFLSINLDGVSNQDNFNKSTDGFFASVYPRQDAVEAVTVTSAVSGSNQGGSGAVTINFTTRAGTNSYDGSVYEYYRNPKFNTNYWFNERDGLPKNDITLHQFGGRFGGPVRIPGVYDGRSRAFFFAHFEQLRFPNSFTRTRTLLNPRALDGWFRYDVGGTTREVNVLQLAAAGGQTSATDPTVLALLNKIQAATKTVGTVAQSTDPLLMSYTFLSPGELLENQPTVRVDVNIGDAHRLTASSATLWASRNPDYLNNTDVRFPGAPNFRNFRSTRPLHTFALRSTIGSSLVNEVRFGITALGGASYFGDVGSGSPNGPASYTDQGGFAIDFDANIGLTNWFTSNSPSWRSAPTISFEESATWMKGSHSFNFGGAVLHSRAWDMAQQMVPGINLGFNTANDPAASLFTATNFPGASSGQLTDARELYALLTGRVTSVTGQAALDPNTNQYVAFGPRRREGRILMPSLFFQDSWRATPTLTVNLGLRWDLQLPYVPVNDIMSTVTLASICGMSGVGDGGTYSKCNFYSPGSSGGTVPEFIQYTAGTKGYETDWNNFAPSIGVAWRPNAQSGFLRTLLGDPDQATLRAGYSVSYERQGLGEFNGTFGANPGSTISLSRSESTGLVGPGETWPVLLSQSDRLYNQPFSADPSFPIAIRPNRADSINAYAPDIEIGSARTWTVGFQRGIGRDTAVEIRYVGTRGVNQWSELNYNTRDIEGNGFFSEFLLAVDNLRVNNTAGGNRAGSFAYFGPGTGTVPLPTYLAYLNGRTDFTNPAAYTGGSNTWTNSAITQDLVWVRPEPGNSAADLDGNLTRRNNALAAGVPANYFVVNPAANEVNVTDSGAYSDYHALQLELRRRMSKNLSANVSYQYAREGGSSFLGFRYGRVMNPSNDSIRHAIKSQWDWIIPVGHGERFGADMSPVLNAVLGGWSFTGVSRMQAKTVNFGNVRLVGMTLDELQSMYYFRIIDDPANVGRKLVTMLPEDVILNTRRAFSVNASSVTGYGALGAPEGRYIAPANGADCIQLKSGDCAPRTTIMISPWFVRFDVGFSKRIQLRGRTNVEVRFDLLNALDNINFNPVGNPGTGATIFQVNSAFTDASNTYDPGGRLGQLMIRFNW